MEMLGLQELCICWTVLSIAQLCLDVYSNKENVYIKMRSIDRGQDQLFIHTVCDPL